MNKQNRIDEFTNAFDLLLKHNPDGFNVTNVENQKLLIFGDRLSQIDYSGESKINQSLKNQLRKRLLEQNTQGELSDDQLGYAAGGVDDLGAGKDLKDNK